MATCKQPLTESGAFGESCRQCSLHSLIPLIAASVSFIYASPLVAGSDASCSRAQTMREKVLARKYRSWRAFMADFDVIFSNAMTYNQKKSRVHHAAEVLVRAGNKLLQAAEEPMCAANPAL